MAGRNTDPDGPSDAWATADITEPMVARAGAGEPAAEGADDPDLVAAGPAPTASPPPPTASPPPLTASPPPPMPYEDPTQARRSRRRHLRQTLTFATFFLLVAGIGVMMLAAYQGRISLPIGDGKPAPLPTCGPAATPTVQSFSATSVHVFNASNRRGLALAVARDLQRRGFRVPSTPTNDPQKTQMTTLAVIRHGAKGLLAAHTLATVVAGPVTYRQDDRLGADVDLVLGQTFALVGAGTAGSGVPASARASGTPRPAGTTPAAPAADSPTCEPAPSPT